MPMLLRALSWTVLAVAVPLTLYALVGVLVAISYTGWDVPIVMLLTLCIAVPLTAMFFAARTLRRSGVGPGWYASAAFASVAMIVAAIVFVLTSRLDRASPRGGSL